VPAPTLDGDVPLLQPNAPASEKVTAFEANDSSIGVGSKPPAGTTLAPLPPQVGEQFPDLAPLRYFLVEDQIALVDRGRNALSLSSRSIRPSRSTSGTGRADGRAAAILGTDRATRSGPRDRVQYFVVGGERPRRLLRVGKPPIDHDLEDAAARLD